MTKTRKLLLCLVAMIVASWTIYAASIRSEDMEGSGTPSGWTNTGTGTIDWDETAVFGEGAQSLEITSAGTNDSTAAPFTAGATRYLHFMFRYGSLTGSTSIASLRSSGSQRLVISVSGAGVMNFQHGTGQSAINLTDAIPADTWVHIWARYTQGTGADGIADVEWCECDTRTGSGTKYGNTTVGQATSTVNEIRLGQVASETHTIYFDHVIVDDADYPDVSGGGGGEETTVPKSNRLLLGGIG
jgi:hypothetical protein